MIGNVKEAIFQEAGRHAEPSTNETIVIAGFPRSGTTWMLELLRGIPGYKALNEPLLHKEARKEHGFGWRTYIAPEETAPEKHAYLETILTGRLGISPAWFFEADSRPGQLLEHARRTRLVVKFCRLNRMLHWFSDSFDVRGPVFIVRHPCAVVASMLKHESWETATDSVQNHHKEQALHTEFLPPELRSLVDPVLAKIKTETELLATLWCLDHYVPLRYHSQKGYPWTLVSYERLVRKGQAELRRITDALGVELTDEMKNQLDDPSSSVRDQLHRDAERQLSKWRRRLSEQQIGTVLRIVDDFGLSDIYTRNLEPDYDQLNEMQRSAGRW
ncbi:hypothetical protein GGP85_002947 [Salinibacter ruber]|uniref:sulfotransferase n=1 Tax=Salinibacter ruber TaxID=146919 RepID=UPI002168C51B|nr:sulfotransferase [Salinibacter ruber]MCS3827477.1 hypothetical protein [Salinibacter ruber]